jgi:hypothetical protein
LPSEIAVKKLPTKPVIVKYRVNLKREFGTNLISQKKANKEGLHLPLFKLK